MASHEQGSRGRCLVILIRCLTDNGLRANGQGCWELDAGIFSGIRAKIDNHKLIGSLISRHSGGHAQKFRDLSRRASARTALTLAQQYLNVVFVNSSCAHSPKK